MDRCHIGHSGRISPLSEKFRGIEDDDDSGRKDGEDTNDY